MIIADSYARESVKDSKASKPSNSAADHKNEGFLKSAWHRLTHQHDNLDTEKPDEGHKTMKDQKDNKSEGGDDEEPKKASGSG